MRRPKGGLEDLERTSAQALRRDELTLAPSRLGEIVERHGDVRMSRAQTLLFEAQGARQQLERFRDTTADDVLRAEVVEGHCNLGAVSLRRSLEDREAVG